MKGDSNWLMKAHCSWMKSVKCLWRHRRELLRVLQDGMVDRLGGKQPIRVDVRIIAATNRDLSAAVKLGTFRADLLYRLNVFPIHLPTLSERSGSIPLLARHTSLKCTQRNSAARAPRSIPTL